QQPDQKAIDRELRGSAAGPRDVAVRRLSAGAEGENCGLPGRQRASAWVSSLTRISSDIRLAMSPTRRTRIAARAKARPWVRLSDEQLLTKRFCDLRLSIQRSPLAAHVRRLYADLERRGIALRPHVWLSEEWFSPDGVPGIAVPFYLAHPRLERLERRIMREAEGDNTRTLAQHYRRKLARNRQIRRGLADELLRRAFSPERSRRAAPRAATLLRAHLRPLVPAVARALRIERYSVEQVLRMLIERSERLKLYVYGNRRDALRYSRWMLERLTG